jgi:thiol-disulfide isomerase/thioredoxin
MRVRAPELRGRRWLNTGGVELSLADLRGKIVLLDFWTFCCVNCLHVLDELRELEERYADVLVTIGVHSPKFAHEADPDAAWPRWSATPCTTPCSTTRSCDVGRVRGAGLADARGDRPAGLRGRADVG